MTAALRDLNPPQPADRHAPGPDLTTELVGPWQVVAFELRHTPTDQRHVQLTLLLWMLDNPTPPPQGPHRSASCGNGSAGSRNTDSAQQGTTIASTHRRDGTRHHSATGPAAGFTGDRPGGATDLARLPGEHLTATRRPTPGYPSIATTFTTTATHRHTVADPSRCP